MVHRSICDLLIVSETKTDNFSSALLRSIGGDRLNAWDLLASQGSAGSILMGWDASVVSKINRHLGTFSLSIQFENLSDSFI